MDNYKDVDHAVTIIIATFNRRWDLDKCISSILKQSYAHLQIVVVDDASEDNTSDFIRNKFPFVKLIVNAMNRGVNYSRNIGIANARSPYVLFLDSDMELTNPEQIFNMVKIISNDCTIGQLGGVYQNPDLDPWGCAFDGSKIFSTDTDILKACDYVASGNLFMKRDMVIESGGFDEFIIGDGTECEMGMNLKRKGFRNIFGNSVAARHHMSDLERNNIGLKLGKEYSNASKYQMRVLFQKRNRLRYYFKYGYLWAGTTYFLKSGATSIISLLAFIKQHLFGFRNAQSEHIDGLGQKFNVLCFKIQEIFDPMIWNISHLPQTLRCRRINFLDDKSKDLC